MVNTWGKKSEDFDGWDIHFDSTTLSSALVDSTQQLEAVEFQMDNIVNECQSELSTNAPIIQILLSNFDLSESDLKVLSESLGELSNLVEEKQKLTARQSTLQMATDDPMWFISVMGGDLSDLFPSSPTDNMVNNEEN